MGAHDLDILTRLCIFFSKKKRYKIFVTFLIGLVNLTQLIGASKRGMAPTNLFLLLKLNFIG